MFKSNQNIVVLLLLVSYNVFAQDIKYHSPYNDLESDASYYLFGNDVKFRKLPNTTSDVLNLLKIGTQVQVLEKMEETLDYNGIQFPFYKVKYKDQIGYILGGLISLEKKESGNSKFLFTYKKTDDDYYILIRHINKTSNYIEASAKLKTSTISFELNDNKGIQDINHVVFINYMGEACGVESGGIYFFQFHQKLKNVFEISQISDAGVFSFSEELIFPKDKNGISDKIIYKSESHSYVDDMTNWEETNIVSRHLSWKDGEILPKLESNP